MESDCRNCGAPLGGRYCAACGQKVPGDEDRRLLPLLAGFLTELTSIDGRFWRSFAALMTRPGLLSAEYRAGRRQRYLAPITLFLIANAVYFLSPGLSDFDLSLVDQLHQAHSRWTRPLLDAVLARRGLGLEAFGPVYALASSNVGKLLLVVHVPFIALAPFLLRGQRRGFYVEHIVFALHLFTFALFYIQILQAAFALTARLGLPDLPLLSALAGTLQLVPVPYFALASRRSYASSWPWALACGAAAMLLLFAANLLVYRSLQFVIALLVA